MENTEEKEKFSEEVKLVSDDTTSQTEENKNEVDEEKAESATKISIEEEIAETTTAKTVDQPEEEPNLGNAEEQKVAAQDKEIKESPIHTEEVAVAASNTVETTTATEPADANQEDSEEEDEQEEEDHQLDYTNYTIKQMVQVLESLLKEDNLSQVNRILKEIKKPFDDQFQANQQEAYERYLADGGEKDGFEYRTDEYEHRFQKAYNKLKEKRNQFYNSLEKQKEQNLLAKQEVLDKLRELVDSEETNASIKALKEIQDKWKSVGVIPQSQAKSLWANYNALLDRFYDQRSIYYELKELDRKKNLELKIELCEKAEQLMNLTEIREAIKQLNELHEEYKHIGPVPKEDQEALWERFKLASDNIYGRRKEYYEKLKGEFKLNELAKTAIAEKVLPFAEFTSEKISDWNKKTKEILEIQKEWEKIGSVPKEKAKEINKQFWSSFKSFFNKKGTFFKKIDEERKANLTLKQELVARAEELKDSEDFRKAADALKELQKQWKEIGPVPEKNRNEIFMKFKKACDHFFNRRRNNSGKVEKEYEENLKQKQTLCEELEKMIAEEAYDMKRVKVIESEWNDIGFVPKTNIRSIQKRYTDAIGKITESADITETEKHKMRFSAQFNTSAAGPGTEKLIQKKEGALRRQISALENDISLWKNNIDFFAASKNADKLKKDFQIKIDNASAELQSLKDQLKVISNI
ncbi:MAG: DUF349 domain-containing protein [Cyclobacteriaceae bacterium]|nr:DUF349 domain-containing protein [Cyclobacteriaceae bacterium]